MIQIVKNILDKAGISVLKKTTFLKMIHKDQMHQLDCMHLLHKVYDASSRLVIADIGANVGQSALKFSNHFPNAIIYSLEPVLSTYQEMKQNTEGNANIRTYQLAAGAEEGEFEITHQANSQWNSLDPSINNNAKQANATTEKVQVITMDRFAKVQGIERIHLLKTDTEGFEMQVFRGANHLLRNRLVDHIYVETGFMQGDSQHTNFCEILMYLQGFQYQFAGMFELSYSPNYEVYYANALFTSKVGNE